MRVPHPVPCCHFARMVSQESKDTLGDDSSQDIFYVCKKALDTVKAKLKDGKPVVEDDVSVLAFPEKLADDELMVPVDMRGVGEEFEDVEQMLEKLGPKGTAEAFIKASDFFEANKDGEPEEERPKPMTAKEWKEVLEDDLLDEGEEEELLEGEEEEEGVDCDDEDGEEEDADGNEPAAKRAKTS